MTKDLETLYEEILGNSVLRVVTQPIPLSPVKVIKSTREDMEEESLEKDEIKIARDILSNVSELDDIAKEAMYKSFRNKIEKHANKIRDLANKLIEKHDKKI